MGQASMVPLIRMIMALEVVWFGSMILKLGREIIPQRVSIVDLYEVIEQVFSTET